MDSDLLAFCKIIRLVEDAISADDNGLQVYVIVVGDGWYGLVVRNKETMVEISSLGYSTVSGLAEHVPIFVKSVKKWVAGGCK